MDVRQIIAALDLQIQQAPSVPVKRELARLRRELLAKCGCAQQPVPT